MKALTVLLLTFSTVAQSQTFDERQVFGIWTFDHFTGDSSLYHEVDTFPIFEFHFDRPNSFKMVGAGFVTQGKFELKDDHFRLFDATKDGRDLKGEQQIGLQELNDTELVVILPRNTGETIATFGRKK